MMGKTIRVLCVDDHDFLVDGLRARLEVEPDLEFVGRISTADHLLSEIDRLQPDVVLLDIEMPGTDPFEALREVSRRELPVRVIILSAYVRDHYIDAAYKAGAWGYVSKSDAPETVIEGIRSVMTGRIAASDIVVERTTVARTGHAPQRPDDIRSKLDALTDREVEILRMIARGMSRTEIASLVSRSPMTIDNHRKSIMKKLGISDRGELVRFAIAEGLVEV